MALRSFPNRYLFSLYSKVTSLFSIRYILEIISRRRDAGLNKYLHVETPIDSLENE